MNTPKVIRAILLASILVLSAKPAFAAWFASSNSFIGVSAADEAQVSRNGFTILNNDTTSARSFVANLGSITGVTSKTITVYGEHQLGGAGLGLVVQCWFTATDTANGNTTFVGANSSPHVSGTHFTFNVTTSGLTSSRTYALGVLCSLPQRVTAGTRLIGAKLP